MTPSAPALRDVLILGGGTAGWLTACYLARQLGAAAPDGMRITLVEAESLPIIGVGEGSFPSLRGTLAAIGLDEARFLRETGASFKQGIVFQGWRQAPVPGAAPDRYFHPFSTPSQRPGSPELVPAWVAGLGGEVPLADAVTLQAAVVAAHRGPKRPGDAPYLGAMNYAYHFDAGRLATLLGQHARSLGVRHELAEVEQVLRRADGGIDALLTRCGRRLQADLFIDCSGLRAELIGRALGEPLHPVGEQLMVDRALALQLPDDPQVPGPLASATVATAQTAGWIWDIALQERRGIGHVYSSHHQSADEAEARLRAYAGPRAAGLPVRPLQLPLGYRRQPWRHNCVAVGLAGGFLEPLEASGIGLIETAAYLIAHLFPHDGQMAPVARHFNAFMARRYERIVDFIKLHYLISGRRDSGFWRDQTDPAHASAELREQLAMWQARPPHRLDFITDVEMYPPSSWQYVLYGMGWRTQAGAWQQPLDRRAAARELAQLQALAPHAVADLPDHRALLARLSAAA